jgi:hypothetical protein
MAGDGVERESELRQRAGAAAGASMKTATTAGTTTNNSESNTPTSKKSVYGRTPDGAS